MSDEFVEVLFWSILVLICGVGVLIWKVSGTLHVDFWSALHMVKFLICAAFVLFAAKAWDSKNYHHKPMIRVETVWPLALVLVWTGLFRVLEVWASDAPTRLIIDSGLTGFGEPIIAWYGTSTCYWLVWFILLAGGYLFNHFKSDDRW